METCLADMLGARKMSYIYYLYVHKKNTFSYDFSPNWLTVWLYIQAHLYIHPYNIYNHHDQHELKKFFCSHNYLLEL